MHVWARPRGRTGVRADFSSGHVWKWELDCEESWALKNWCFCIPWTARRSNQSILKEISPECSLEGLMLKLKLQYFGHLMGRFDSLEKTLILGGLGGAGGEGDERGREGWMASPTWWTRVWVNSGSLWWTGRPGMLQFMGSQRIGHGWVTELHWTGEFSGSLGCLTHHSPAKVSGLISDCWIEISQIMSHGIKGNWSKHIWKTKKQNKKPKTNPRQMVNTNWTN